MKIRRIIKPKSSKNIQFTSNISQFPEDIFNPHFYESLLNLSGTGYFILSPKKDRFFISARAKIIFGIPPEKNPEFMDFIHLIIPEDQIKVTSAIDNIKPDSSGTVEFRIQKTDQKDILLILSHLQMVSIMGSVDVITASIADNSKDEKLRRELLKLKERSNNEAKLRNLFLSNISHEIRTPMNSIIGYSELLNISAQNDSLSREYAKIIKSQGDHLLKLIDDIAEVVMFQLGELNINKTPCNLNLLLNELYLSFTRYKADLNKDNLDIRLNLPDKSGIITNTDTGRLQQVLSNLLTNAFKFTSRGYVEFGYRKANENTIEFFVRDTGVGITKEEQKYIFDRLKIGEETPVKKFEGSGLGLTISKAIIKLLGGRIWIESEPNVGSSFYFTLPYEEIIDTTATQQEETPATSIFKWRGKVLLIVEDEDVNSRFLDTILHDSEAQLLHAKNGLQAVELCKTINKIDLILMDIKMPVLNGFDATRKIREFNSKVPIIAQTAYAMDEERQKCIQAGCNDLVVKPIDVEVLLYMINKYLT